MFLSAEFQLFILLLSFITLFVWVFESKATMTFKYPALFGFFILTEYVAIPLATMSVMYIMSFEYPSLAQYATYQTGLFVAVLILGIAFLVKVGNKYIAGK